MRETGVPIVSLGFRDNLSGQRVTILPTGTSLPRINRTLLSNDDKYKINYVSQDGYVV